MQILAAKKRKAAEQAELEALGAENDLEAIELEIEVVKRKGCIEETFWRFPHIGQQIFEELDDTSLSKSLLINKWWQKIINERKILQINQLEKHTYIKSSILKKALCKEDFETVQKLANYSMKVYTKVLMDGKNIGLGYNYKDYRKQQKYIIGYLLEKKHRNKIQHMLTELMLKNTKEVTIEEITPLIRNGEFEILQILFKHYKACNDNFLNVCKKVHLRWSNGDYSSESAKEAILILYPERTKKLNTVFKNESQ
jgi:hypothetical protein